MKLRALVIFGLLACATAAGDARAQQPEAEAAALTKFESGRALFEEGHWDRALADFQASYHLFASPNSRLYIARCFEKLGKVASAYVNFRFAAREAHDRLVATGEKRYGLTRDAAIAEQGDLEPRVPRVTIAVPAGVSAAFVVKENGAPVAREAWGTAVETDPGHLVLEAVGPRLRPFRRDIDVVEGQQLRVEIPAERVPTAIVRLHFEARPVGMAVDFDHAPVDPRELDAPREVDPGAHAVAVTAPGYAPFAWQRVLADGDRATVDVRLSPALPPAAEAKGTPKWLFFATAGVSAAALVVGTWIAVEAKSLSDDEQAKYAFYRDPGAQDEIRRKMAEANLSFGIGALFGAGAAVLAFTTRWRGAPALVVQTVGAGGVVSARGSF